MFWTQRQAQIECLIEQMDGAPFQRLAEDYLQLKYPKVFHYLDPQGRKANGRTIPGSPDIVGQTSKGAIILAEVSKKDDWFSWVRDYLRLWGEKKGRGEIGTIAGFYAVSWHEHKPERPRDEQNRQKIYQLANQHLNLKPQDMVLIFRRQLVRDLAQPKFAQTVLHHLGLRWNVYPFTHANEAPNISPEFAPTAEEFKSGKVQVPEEPIDRIDLALRSSREILVLGEPASGKTVLAWFYGFRHLATLRPALYLDCDVYQKSFTDIIKHILEVIEAWRSPELLVLIDNVHLILEHFRLLRQQLRSQQTLGGNIATTSDAFSVVYLGRRRADLSKLQMKCMSVKADPHVFRAVYTRLALRYNVVAPFLPDCIFVNWAEEFAGDLISFSVAVNACGPKLANPDTIIDPSLALDSVRERYLKPVQDETVANRNFLRLCALAELEIRAPHEIFKTATRLAYPFGSMIDKGIVSEERGAKDSISYSLPHPNLGRLILDAAPDSPTREDLLKEACRQHPPLITQVLSRSRKERDEMDVDTQKIEEIFNERDFLDKWVATLNLFQGYLLLRDLERESPKKYQLVKEYLAQKDCLHQLVECALETPLVHLTTFLKYAEETMPEIWRLLKEELVKAEYRQRLINLALENPLHFLKDFFYYSQRHMPEVWPLVKEGLTEQESIKILLGRAPNTPLDILRPFLAYIQTEIPQVWVVLRKELTQEKYHEHLLRLTLGTRLDGISAFLRYADKAMPEVAEVLKDDLSREEAVEELLKHAIYNSPLSNLKPFLQYAEKAIPVAAATLKRQLALEKHRERLTALILESPLYHVKDFLVYAERAIPLVAASLKEDLRQQQSVRILVYQVLETPLNFVSAFLRYVEKTMPEVATAVKQRLARGENRKRLLNLALKTPLGDLISFLDYTEDFAPQILSALESGFKTKRNHKRLLTKALDSPLEQLSAFLYYVEKSMPQIATALKEELVRDENCNRLLMRALDTSLEHVTRFLKYTEETMPHVWGTLKGGLASEENRHRVVSRALNTSLEHLLTFLRYAEEAMPKMSKVLVEELSRDENQQRLLKRAAETRSHHLADFLRYAEVRMPEIAKRIRSGSVAKVDFC